MRSRETWWARNWRWLVPTLVLATVSLIVVAGGGLAFWLFSGGDHRMYSSWDEIAPRVQASPQVRAALGTPVQMRGMLSGQTCSQMAGHKRVDMQAQIRGPKGDGVLTAIGSREDAQWQWNTLTIQVDASGQRIDLLGPQDLDPSTGERWPHLPCWKIAPPDAHTP